MDQILEDFNAKHPPEDDEDDDGEVTSFYDDPDDDQALDSDPWDVDRDEYEPGGRYFD